MSQIDQLILESQDLQGSKLTLHIRNVNSITIYLIQIYKNDVFMATFYEPLPGNSVKQFILPGSYKRGDEVTIMTDIGEKIKFRVM